MIAYHGILEVEPEVLGYADQIKLQNYKTNTPKRFQVEPLTTNSLLTRLSGIIGEPTERLDFVYFSVCKGAEPHTDALDPEKFESKTFVIPIILPSGTSYISTEDDRVAVHLNGIYEFNHEQLHSMELEDTESGCVVIMVAVIKPVH